MVEEIGLPSVVPFGVRNGWGMELPSGMAFGVRDGWVDGVNSYWVW